MSSGRRLVVAGVVAVVVALAPPGVASADNSDNNTNNNDVTHVGDPSLAHRADERVPVGQITAAVDMLRGYLNSSS